MTINTNENVILFDVDQTLIMHEYKLYPLDRRISVDYYGISKIVVAHLEHIKLLKSYKKRRFFIRVHSNNGFLWAKQIVQKLDLEEFVDSVESKPTRHVDDATNSVEVMGPRVYLEQIP